MRRPVLILALALVIAVSVACGGEEEKRSGVIVSSDSTVTPTPSAATAQASGEYRPLSDVDAHAKLALDIRDAAALMAPATKSQPVDWAAVKAVYEKGGNSLKEDGSARTLASLATSKDVLAQFPDGAKVFGTASFLNANVRAGLEGIGRGAGISDNARRQLVEKGFSAILYGKVLQELDAARAKIQKGDLGNASGAPHNVDEAWAFYMGAKDNKGNYSYSLSSTAKKREKDFGLEGKLDSALQSSLSAAQKAAQAGDLAAFHKAKAQVQAQLNTIFYLASVKYAGQAASATEEGARQVVLAEGWAFFQTIRPSVASGSAEAASTIEAFYAGDASKPVSAEAAKQVVDALNSPAVLRALGIPRDMMVSAPPR